MDKFLFMCDLVTKKVELLRLDIRADETERIRIKAKIELINELLKLIEGGVYDDNKKKLV